MNWIVSAARFPPLRPGSFSAHENLASGRRDASLLAIAEDEDAGGGVEDGVMVGASRCVEIGAQLPHVPYATFERVELHARRLHRALRQCCLLVRQSASEAKQRLLQDRVSQPKSRLEP